MNVWKKEIIQILSSKIDTLHISLNFAQFLDVQNKTGVDKEDASEMYILGKFPWWLTIASMLLLHTSAPCIDNCTLHTLRGYG